MTIRDLITQPNGPEMAAAFGAMARDPGVRRAVMVMMSEAKSVAETLGIGFPVSMDERIDMAAAVGDHRTSMLQDAEAGRPTELESLLGSVIELGRMTGVVTPMLELIYDLTKARCRISAVPSR